MLQDVPMEKTRVRTQGCVFAVLELQHRLVQRIGGINSSRNRYPVRREAYLVVTSLTIFITFP